jgi:hypothetical protein
VRHRLVWAKQRSKCVKSLSRDSAVASDDCVRRGPVDRRPHRGRVEQIQHDRLGAEYA